ncbi:hypothetical protein BDR05DRAFT_1018774 [Suillus weaverae]|nr:hypothetical protein BDR05DRAFT_1018774 [Suillus weaverae]
MRYTMACQRMTRAAKGVHGRLLKKLYEGVVVPKMLYAADVWCSGLIVKGLRSTRFCLKDGESPMDGNNNDHGGMRTTTTDLLDAHANILPFQQLLCKECHRATLRMIMLGKTLRNFESCKRHPFPLHCLLNEFKLDPHTIKTINLTRHYPKWTPDITTEMAGDMTTAARNDAAAEEDL